PSTAHSFPTRRSSDLCRGSLIPNLLAPDIASFEAAEGTVAHSVHEEWLKTGEKPVHMLGRVERVQEGNQVFEIEIDREMLNNVGDRKSTRLNSSHVKI